MPRPQALESGHSLTELIDKKTRRARKLYRLSYYFFLVSIPTLLIAILAVVWMYRVVVVEDMIYNGERSNTVLAKSTTNVVWPKIREQLTALASAAGEAGTDLTGHRREQLLQAHAKTHAIVVGLIKETPVVKLRIFDPQGITLYSTDKGEIGVQEKPASFTRQVLETGKSRTTIHFQGRFASLNGVLKERYIMNGYLPLTNAQGLREAVVEVYTDVTTNYRRMGETQTKFLLALCGIAFIAYTILFSVIFHSDRIIMRQSYEREQHLKQLRKINKELEIARDKESTANIAKSQFLANMSHELRTPLNAIIGYSEMLEEDTKESGEPLNLKDLQQIQVAGRHLLALIDEVLDLSKVESGHSALNRDKIDIGKFIHEIVEMTRPAAYKNNSQLHVQIEEELTEVTLDQAKLKQVILNLLSNAVKFTRDGDITIQVREELGEHTHWIIFVVKDTGIGMSPNVLDKIFDPFTQADSSSTRKYGGTGLGLTITQRFCKIMGGSVTVCSHEGVGSTFVVRLPRLDFDVQAEQSNAGLDTANNQVKVS